MSRENGLGAMREITIWKPVTNNVKERSQPKVSVKSGRTGSDSASRFVNRKSATIIKDSFCSQPLGSTKTMNLTLRRSD